MQTTLDQIPELPLELDPEELLDEVRVYLDAVDVFRLEGCEPEWVVERP